MEDCKGSLQARLHASEGQQSNVMFGRLDKTIYHRASGRTLGKLEYIMEFSKQKGILLIPE